MALSSNSGNSLLRNPELKSSIESEDDFDYIAPKDWNVNWTTQCLANHIRPSFVIGARKEGGGGRFGDFESGISDKGHVSRDC